MMTQLIRSAGLSSGCLAATRFFEIVGMSVSARAEQAEPLGPCTRRTPLVISEIMYHPAPRPDQMDLDYVEIHNSQPWFFDLSGFRLAGDITFTFPAGSVLAANAFLVVARVPADVRQVYGITNVIGGHEGQLGQPSGSVRLEHRSGAVLVDVEYQATHPWPVAPDGAGPSLVLARPSLGQRDPAAWAASARVGGSPGVPEPVGIEPLRTVVINEVLARSAAPGGQYIELYNHSPNEADVGNCWIGSGADPGRFRLGADTRIAPGGFLVLNRDHLGFELQAAGDTVHLSNPDRTVVLDAVRFGALAEGIPHGRFPNGAPVVRMLGEPTPGTSNDRFYMPDVVIHEIMYHPITDDRRDEYVELHNGGSEIVDLGGWRFVDGIDYAVPPGTRLAPGGYLVIARDAAWLRSKYDSLTDANTLGDYQGSLSNGGERIALARPELISSSGDGQGGTLARLEYVLVDEVSYGDGGHWGQWADGGGSSLELIHPRTDHLRPSSWADSDESGKGEWALIEATGRMEPYSTQFSPIIRPADLQVMILGQGECLLDDVEFLPLGSGSLVANGSFEEGLTGWSGQGTHRDVRLASGGFQSDSCARLLTSGRGEPMANRFLGILTDNFRPDAIATLRARAKWLRGSPELLLRVTCNFLEAYGRLPVPANLGTPGAANSRAVANAGPAIGSVEHDPILPKADQSVVIHAQVHDPDGLADVQLRYRTDQSAEVYSLPMTDDGLGGDIVARDGVYAATLPGQRAQVLVAYHVMARDPAGAVSYEPTSAPERECLVRFGDPVVEGQFGVYRLWMTGATFNEWSRRTPLSNHPLPVTFVYGTHRAIHNVGALYAGNTFFPNMDSPTGNACDYALVFPSDEPMLGETDMVLSWPGLMEAPDPTAQREQMAFWIGEQMGLPFNYRRYVVVIVQGARRNQIMEDAQQPNRELVQQWFPQDSDGDLYKMNVQQDAARSTGQHGYYGLGTLEDLPIPDSRQKLSRYRWVWQKRSAQGTMNEHQALFELIQAMNLPDGAGYSQAVEALVDVDQWMRTMAAERVVGNWDSFGYHLNKNMYFYKPERAPWKLLMWDSDQWRDASTSGGNHIFSHADSNFPDLLPDPTTQRWFAHPPFRRAYLRALQAAVDGPTLAAAGLLDAKWAAFQTNGIRVTSPSVYKTFLIARRQSILQQLAPFTVPFHVDGATDGAMSTAEATVTLTGRAPFKVEAIQVNGVAYQATWATPTNWSLTLPVREAHAELKVAGLGVGGEPVPDVAAVVAVNYTGTEPLPPVRVCINEWMAANTRTLADPADNDFEDWFELYNPNPFPVNLSGYFLTDDLAAPAKFVVPVGTVVPARGRLLAWADEETGQNLAPSDLHVNFKLRQAGEVLALYDSAGLVVDWVQFGPQIEDVTEGRWPDGASAPFHRMPLPTPRAANLSPEAAPPPRITDFEASTAGVATLTWTAELGSLFRVEMTDRLDPANWTLAGEVMAWGPTAGVTIRAGSGAKFIRLVK